jgi:predicted esterase
MNLNNNDIVTIGDIKKASKVIFWFHGYGSNNWSFEPIMKVINMQMNDEVCIIMPNAPLVDNKRSWYPLPMTSENGLIKEDNEGLETSKAEVSRFINSFTLEKGQDVIVGGFSQGAALSLSMLFNTSHNFYGCIALSGYMPSADYYKDSAIMNSRIFIAHGFSDQAISFEDYKKTYEFLCSKTKEIVSYTGDFGHTVTKDVSNKVSEWLSK